MLIARRVGMPERRKWLLPGNARVVVLYLGVLVALALLPQQEKSPMPARCFFSCCNLRFIFLLEFLNFEFSPPPISNSSRGCVVADSEHLLCTHCRRTLSEIWNQNRSMYCRMLRHNHVLLCAIHTNMSPLGDNNTPSVSRETLTCAVPAAFRRIGWLRVQADVRGWRWRRHGVLIKSNKLRLPYIQYRRIESCFLSDPTLSRLL